MERAKNRDVVLGRTLAETAELNSPEHLAGAEARAAVQRAGPDAERIAQNRRRFRIAVLVLFLVLTLIAALAWLTERVTQAELSEPPPLTVPRRAVASSSWCGEQSQCPSTHPASTNSGDRYALCSRVSDRPIYAAPSATGRFS